MVEKDTTPVIQGDEIKLEPKVEKIDPINDVPIKVKVVKGKTRKRKKRRKNSTRKPAEPKTKPKSDYEDLTSEYEGRLDDDTKSMTPKQAPVKKEGDDIIDNSDEEVDPPRPKIPGKSLVSMTKIVSPILIMVAVRVITWGKKKPTLDESRFDEEDIETLEELADNAADEILGNLTPGQLYLITWGSLAAAKAMEHFDFGKFYEMKITKETDVVEDKRQDQIELPPA